MAAIDGREFLRTREAAELAGTTRGYLDTCRARHDYGPPWQADAEGRPYYFVNELLEWKAGRRRLTASPGTGRTDERSHGR